MLLLAFFMVSIVFYDVIFLGRTLQPSNISPHMGKPIDWQATSVLPSLSPDSVTSDGFADLNASAWQFEPARYWVARALRDGESLWWNPYSASGTLGPETLVDIKLSPHTLISAVCCYASSESFDYGLVVIYALGVWCMLLIFLQIFQLDMLAAVAGASVYLLNGFAVPNLNTHIGQPYFCAPVLL